MRNGNGARDAVIISGWRTPFGKRGGQFSGLHPVEMLSFTLKALIERTGINPELVEDVIGGCVGQVGEQALNVTRSAWLDAGLPESTPATTVDRQCGSGLQAIQFAAQGVMAGGYDLVVACGVENMSRVPLGSQVSPDHSPMTQAVRDRYHVEHFNQAIGAEMIAKKWGLSRAALDEYSARSHARAATATAKGWLAQEIVPVPINGGAVEHDQGIRPETSVEKLATLKPAFEGLELLTAGNSSQISDGAGAVLIASRQKAEELGLQPRARFVQFTQVGSDPVMMLTGPIPATRRVLQRAGLSTQDIDLFEVNEAFAPVCLAWQEELGVGVDRLNVNGGAIALGHPLGASGVRLVLTALNELERRDGHYALTAICEGGGMANASIIERLD
ncbi:MAG: thiolase family protein [Chloroflexi bacterium]|nr:MAG: thiolase family protein [Chloroflexota bacterium]